MRALVASGMLVLAMHSGPAAAQASNNDGAALLARSGCTACHGADGRGTALAPGITDSSLDLERFIAAVRAPRGTMPAYAPVVLSDDDIETIRDQLVAVGPQTRPAGNAQAGGERYERVGCYSCHSNQGQGVMHGPRIAPSPIRWERFTWYVRQPSGQMPPYSAAVLSDQDLADIHEFLATRPEPQPVSDILLLAP